MSNFEPVSWHIRFYRARLAYLNDLMAHSCTDPWEHLLAIGLGAGFGNAVANWEVRLQEDLDKKLSEVQTANNKRYIGNNSSLVTLQHCP